jgi:hypothetical protein
VGVFTLLAVHGVGLGLRHSLLHRGLVWVWVMFCGIAAAASMMIWLLVMLLTFRLLSPQPAIFTAFLAIAVFPMLAVLFAHAHRSVADPEQA